MHPIKRTILSLEASIARTFQNVDMTRSNASLFESVKIESSSNVTAVVVCVNKLDVIILRMDGPTVVANVSAGIAYF